MLQMLMNNSVYGVPAWGAKTIQGNVFYVRPVGGSDGNDGKNPLRAFKTLVAALAACTANQNDTVFFLAESNTSAATTDYQSALLDWNKDMVHLIGVGTGTMINGRSRISSVSTSVLPLLMKVSANGCIISNISVFYGVASALALGCLSVTGQRNLFHQVTVQGIGNITQDALGAYDLVLDGAEENTFVDCYIGTDTIARTVNSRNIILKNGATRNIFRSSLIVSYATDANYRFVQKASAGIDRFCMFDNCDFINMVKSGSAASLTEAFDITAGGSPNGLIIVKNCSLTGAALWETSAGASTELMMVGVAKLATQTGMITFPTA